MKKPTVHKVVKKLICKFHHLHLREMKMFNCSKNGSKTVLPHRQTHSAMKVSAVHKPFLLLASKGAGAALCPSALLFQAK